MNTLNTVRFRAMLGAAAGLFGIFGFIAFMLVQGWKINPIVIALGGIGVGHQALVAITGIPMGELSQRWKALPWWRRWLTAIVAVPLLFFIPVSISFVLSKFGH